VAPVAPRRGRWIASTQATSYESCPERGGWIDKRRRLHKQHRIDSRRGVILPGTRLDDARERESDAALLWCVHDLPGYRLHPLKGDLKGLWSVTISGSWRIVFRLQDGDGFDVDLVDYH
jgi:hypothetical protein